MPWYTTNHARRDAERQALQRAKTMNAISKPLQHGSDAHLDLIGAQWHMHMFGGQDRADILAFGRACMEAERERCARIVEDMVRAVDGAEALDLIRTP